MMDAMRAAFVDRNLDIRELCWDDEATDWSTYDAVIIGTTWDYWDRRDEYVQTLAKIGDATHLWNPIEMVRWNIDKRYLRDLEAKGAPMIPTLWLDDPSETAITEAFDHLKNDDLVIKRQIGASSDGQHRIRRGDPIPGVTLPMFAQPFQTAIINEGEYSFIFVDGELSHVLNKQAAEGDYRIQSEFGGFEKPHEPSPQDEQAATHIMSLLDETPLYARVDMLRREDGALALMEIELIEPYLYPEQGPELGPRLAAAIERRLAN